MKVRLEGGPVHGMAGEMATPPEGLMVKGCDENLGLVARYRKVSNGHGEEAVLQFCFWGVPRAQRLEDMTRAQELEAQRIQHRHGPVTLAMHAGILTVGLQKLDPHNQLYAYLLLDLDRRGHVRAAHHLAEPGMDSDEDHGLLRVA